MDIRLKTRRFTLGGKTYDLAVNMNVLADLQEMHGGSILEALDKRHEMRTAIETLAAMINDANDASGSAERVTPRQVGRMLTVDDLNELRGIVGEMLSAALARDEAAEPVETDEETEKN